MKILHVLDTSIPDTAGYTTRANYLVSCQKQQGVEPVVLTSERLKGGSGAAEEHIDGVRYYRTVRKSTGIRKVPFVAEIDEIRTLAQRIREVATKERVDLVHAHSPSLNGAASLKYCRAHNIPLIYEIRAFWEDAAVDRGAFAEGSIKYRLRQWHETSVVKQADAVVVICRGLRDDLLQRGIDQHKIHVVQNGVDHTVFQPIPPDQDLKIQLGLQDKIIIGFIGSFFHFEGLQDLIKAMPAIVSANKDIVLLLVGAGQVERQLQESVRNLGLAERVVFTGKVPHEQVGRYYSIIDLLVYPRISKRITELVTPLKPLEAMAMEKAVLMSDVGGLLELADGERTASFFKAGDIADLAAKCLDLCADKEQRVELGQRARANVITKWGWDRRAATDIALYETHLRVGP
ncbi:TIGR04063 family PEP-CTERM/XrtA system glycosyltransferase [Desulfobulbus alkaliphilus]|uniref:TIGR04063 family PEP-CTERM/XrtA system glycosyltransferase n=1 Tax=Desulfobulbus alkaliphilus TaxID=869814 RepID=UPI0019636D56|nr:TIGR04063 family PEP-CTERM/XrtA system glycosyltransferase [Desulfobulbus alkaliphilus]MBM9538521.1 glycosyltransferase, exosortase A system-associated [Desulfobulbus alkaliphilus]